MFWFIFSIFMAIFCIAMLIFLIFTSDGSALWAIVLTILLGNWIDTAVDEHRKLKNDKVETPIEHVITDVKENVITVKDYEVTTNYSVTNGDTTIVNYTIRYEDIEEGI